MLSGNTAHPMKNSSGVEDGEHVIIYRSEDIASHEDVEMTVGGLILIGLLRGGDYAPEGLPGCGPNVAHALARCGFGDTLLEAAQTLPRERLPSFLSTWRHEVKQELKSNAHGYLNTKKVKLAASITEDFPDIDILLLYSNPLTSAKSSQGLTNYLWDREPDLGKLAALCERKFEWGVREIIVKRFRTVIWAPTVLRILRRAALDDDERKRKADGASPFATPRKAHKSQIPISPGTPSAMITKHFSSLRIDENDDDDRLIVKIHSKREHATTDGVPEYRLEIAPAQLVRLTESGVQGFRKLPDKGDLEDDSFDEDEDEDGGKKRKNGPKKPPPEPDSHLRVWMPASMVRVVEPELVDEFEDSEGKKRKKKQDAAERKALKAQGVTVPKKSRATGSVTTKARSKKVASTKSLIPDETEEESEEDFSDVFGMKGALNKGKGKPVVKPDRVRKLPVFEEEEEEEEESEIASKASAGSKSRKENKPPSELSYKTKGSRQKPDQVSHASRPPPLLDLLDQASGISVHSKSTKTSSVVSKGRVESQRSAAPFPDIFTTETFSRGEKRTSWKGKEKQTTASSKSTKSFARVSSALTSDSDSPSILASPKKSPRKSKEHVSPKSIPFSKAGDRGQTRTSSSSGTGMAAMRPFVPLLAARARNISNGSSKPQVKPPVQHEEEVEDSCEEEEEEECARPGSPSPMRPKHGPRSNGTLGMVTNRPFNVSKAMPKAMQPVRTIERLTVIELSSDSELESPPSSAPKVNRVLAKPRKLASRASVEIIDLT